MNIADQYFAIGKEKEGIRLLQDVRASINSLEDKNQAKVLRASLDDGTILKLSRKYPRAKSMLLDNV